MKKTAVLLFGLPRGNTTCWKSLDNNICKKHNADIFIHTWILDVQNKSTNWHKNKEPNARNIKKFLAFFCDKNVKKIYLEKQVKYQPEIFQHKGNDVYYSNQVNMWKSVASACSLLKEYQKFEGVEYENVVITRGDLIFNKEVSLPENIENGELYHGGVVRQGALNGEDLLMVVNSRSLDKFTRVLNRTIERYYVDNDIYNPLMDEFSLKSVNYTYDVDFIIKRSSSIFVRAFNKILSI